jgi:hypothetical protein
MTKIVKIILAISISILIVSTIGLFSSDKLYSPIFWFISANTIGISLAFIHIKRANSNRLFGGYLIAFVLFYSWINYQSNWGLESIFHFDIEHLNYFSRTILTLLLFGFGASQLIAGGQFEQLRTKKIFWTSIISLTFFLITEISMYDVHGDFGGNPHGHSYLKGFHLH